VDDRAGLVDQVLGGQVLPATVTLTKQALGGTYRTVTAALTTYRRVAASVAEELVATLRVVAPLADAERTKVAEILSRQYGKTVHVNEVIDPEVLGGVHIEIGDDVIDGTVASRVAEARRLLVG
jgi:F-type H+-transporting ATPase subunit delta